MLVATRLKPTGLMGKLISPAALVTWPVKYTMTYKGSPPSIRQAANVQRARCWYVQSSAQSQGLGLQVQPLLRRILIIS